MEDIIHLAKDAQILKADLPFYVYSACHEQNIFNIPISKPILIFVLSGQKEFGEGFNCNSEQFVFFSDNHSVHMRNIPDKNQYFAILIEFDEHDFEHLPVNNNKVDYFVGDICSEIKKCLYQFIEISTWAPQSVLSLRKKEILMLLFHLGYREVFSIFNRFTLNRLINEIFIKHKFHDITTDKICNLLAMSQSTLRRKLQSENTSIKEIKERARLGLGLHLLQTTEKSVNLISDECGYKSQSRFTQSFKKRFGLTPSDLRRTKQSL